MTSEEYVQKYFAAKRKAEKKKEGAELPEYLVSDGKITFLVESENT